MALAGREIRERHLVTAADFRIQMMHLARESIWRKPFCHRVGVQKRFVNSHRRGANHSMKSNGTCCCGLGFFRHYDFLSTNFFSSSPMIVVQPVSKFFRAYAGVFGNVSIPVWASFNRVFSPSSNNSNVTSELPGSPL